MFKIGTIELDVFTFQVSLVAGISQQEVILLKNMIIMRSGMSVMSILLQTTNLCLKL